MQLKAFFFTASLLLSEIWRQADIGKESNPSLIKMISQQKLFEKMVESNRFDIQNTYGPRNGGVVKEISILVGGGNCS